MDKQPLPVSVCSDCGKRYCKQPSKALYITVNKESPCGVCGASDVWVAPEYDYGWLREDWRAEHEALLSSAALESGK